MAHKKPHLVPEIHKSRFTRQDGEYEIAFARFSEFNERASSTVISELSLQDLEVLRDMLSRFLDDGRYQEIQ